MEEILRPDLCEIINMGVTKAWWKGRDTQGGHTQEGDTQGGHTQGGEGGLEEESFLVDF